MLNEHTTERRVKFGSMVAKVTDLGFSSYDAVLFENLSFNVRIISAGFDTHEGDPIGSFKLTTTYYKELGERIKKLDIPTLVLQEGGYAIESLGLNVVALLSGLLRY